MLTTQIFCPPSSGIPSIQQRHGSPGFCGKKCALIAWFFRTISGLERPVWYGWYTNVTYKPRSIRCARNNLSVVTCSEIGITNNAPRTKKHCPFWREGSDKGSIDPFCAEKLFSGTNLSAIQVHQPGHRNATRRLDPSPMRTFRPNRSSIKIWSLSVHCATKMVGFKAPKKSTMILLKRIEKQQMFVHWKAFDLQQLELQLFGLSYVDFPLFKWYHSNATPQKKPGSTSRNFPVLQDLKRFQVLSFDCLQTSTRRSSKQQGGCHPSSNPSRHPKTNRIALTCINLMGNDCVHSRRP